MASCCSGCAPCDCNESTCMCCGNVCRRPWCTARCTSCGRRCPRARPSSLARSQLLRLRQRMAGLLSAEAAAAGFFLGGAGYLLHCISLHFTKLSWTALPITALRCTPPHCSVLYFVKLYETPCTKHRSLDTHPLQWTCVAHFYKSGRILM